MSVLERLLLKCRPDESTGCWEWRAHKTSKGYGRIQIDGRAARAHRASYELHVGPIPECFQVLHRCDNPGCINPAHLFLGTNADNMSDKKTKQRQAQGARIGRSKLTEENVRAIRAANGISLRKLATIYGVGHTQILKIRSRERWSHLR